MVRKATLILAVCGGLALAGCKKAEPAAAQGQFNTTISMADLMNRVIDPVTQRMLGRAGTVDTAEGTKSKLPASDEEWQLAENEATILVESGNMLLIPARVRKADANDTDWVKYSNLLIQLALDEKAAIAAKDGQKMFDTGAKIWDDACTGCHKKYVIPNLPKA